MPANLDYCTSYINALTENIEDCENKLRINPDNKEFRGYRLICYKEKIVYISAIAARLNKQQLYKYITSILPIYFQIYNKYNNNDSYYDNYDNSYKKNNLYNVGNEIDSLPSKNKQQLIHFLNNFSELI